jgi:hypothetical protein
LWGLDLLAPFKKAFGGFTCLLVIVDKFTKWIEAKSFILIKYEYTVDFIYDIEYRFKVHNAIITNNSLQFIRKKFLLLLSEITN